MQSAGPRTISKLNRPYRMINVLPTEWFCQKKNKFVLGKANIFKDKFSDF
jgi:hypothetical protein